MKLELKDSIIRLDPENVNVKYILDTLPVLKRWNPSKSYYLLPSSCIKDLITLFPNATLSPEIQSLIKEQYKTYRTIVGIKEGNRETIDFLSLPMKNPKLLRKYQKIGIEFAASGRVLIADEMGLGKALMAIATALTLKQRYKLKKILVVCPNSIKYSVWQKEIKKWTYLKSLIIEGDKKERIKSLINIKATFVVANYEAVRNLQEYFVDWKPDIVILDESHAIKNNKAKQTVAIKNIKAPYRILLTGTPVLNRVEELWSQLNYLDPIYWYSYTRFVQRYCTFEEKWFPYVRRKIKVVSGYQNLEELQERIYSYYIRRTKEEVLPELPECVPETRLIELHFEQKKKYNELATEYRTEIAGKTVKITKNMIAVKIQKLLQLCDSLELLGGEDISSKLDEAINIFETLKDTHKIVYFTWFVKTAKALERRLSKLGNVVEIDGQVSVVDRTARLNEFSNNPKCKALIATIATCGVGLDLTAADVCVFVSRSYTPAINQQAVARLYRHGQKRMVNVITLITRGTVEERVSTILETKQDMFEALFRDKKNIETLFTNV